MDENLGRFRLGDKVGIRVEIEGGQLPDDNPTATIMATNGGTAATQRMSFDRAAGAFRCVARLGPAYGLGTYAVNVTYSLAGVSYQVQSAFTVVGGGDRGGAVISLYAFDRPEGRYVLAQLDGGKLVQGRNPKL